MDVKEVWPHQFCDEGKGSHDQTIGSFDSSRKLKYTEQEHTELLQQVHVYVFQW